MIRIKTETYFKDKRFIVKISAWNETNKFEHEFDQGEITVTSEGYKNFLINMVIDQNIRFIREKLNDFESPIMIL